ncbi:MAG: hypothetical protein KDE25_11195 [Novosphingobium sp.]|nr:hypothetical protein [Novosphingobium sp.]
MKLLRWAVAGAASASVYVVYRYSIGKKAKGEDVFASPDDGVAKLDDARAKRAGAGSTDAAATPTTTASKAKPAPAKPRKKSES